MWYPCLVGIFHITLLGCKVNIALILAGGVGTRVGEPIPKQFIDVNGKPIIVHTLQKFQNSCKVDAILISCIPDTRWVDFLKNQCARYKISKLIGICSAGQSGLESAKNGVDFLACFDNQDLVLIHDAVRPFVDLKSISENVLVAEQYGNAVCAIECVETLIHSSDGIISDGIIDRVGLKRVLTPQTFRLDILRDLFSTDDFRKTRSPSVFAYYMEKGHQVYFSKGSEANIKITYPEDIEYSQKILS